MGLNALILIAVDLHVRFYVRSVQCIIAINNSTFN